MIEEVRESISNNGMYVNCSPIQVDSIDSFLTRTDTLENYFQDFPILTYTSSMDCPYDSKKKYRRPFKKISLSSENNFDLVDIEILLKNHAVLSSNDKTPVLIVNHGSSYTYSKGKSCPSIERFRNSTIHEVDVSTKKRKEPLNFTRAEAQLLAVLKDEISESGYVNPSEDLFAKLLQEDRLKALNAISRIFMDNINEESRNNQILVNILHLLSHLDYKTIYPNAQLIAAMALNHSSDVVCEFAIKCFENWGTAEGAEKLKAVTYSREWLKGYAEEVIRDITGDQQWHY